MTGAIQGHGVYGLAGPGGGEGGCLGGVQSPDYNMIISP